MTALLEGPFYTATDARAEEMEFDDRTLTLITAVGSAIT